MHLTAIMVWHSRYIVGYELLDTLYVSLVISCVKKAIQKYGRPEIISSDQGSQFTSHEYINLLKENKIQISMDGKGHWADSIIIESFFRTLKYDDIYIYHYDIPKALRLGINRFMKSYNEEHPYEYHNYQTPVEVCYGI